MELNDAQKQAVAGWVEDGCGLSEIQKRLSSEFELSMTYMDVRFLVIDLGLEIHEESTQSPPEPAPLDGDDAGDDTVPADVEPSVPSDAEPGPASAGAVVVDLDRLMKPGTVVSGTVTFSDGVNASWGLDQMGRLALDAGDPQYRPCEEDLRTFQDELRKALETKGF